MNSIAEKNPGSMGEIIDDPEKIIEHVLNTINDIIFSIDLVNGRVTRLSNACEKLYGYKASDFYNNHLLWMEIIHPDDQHLVAHEDELLKQGLQVNNLHRIICKDGAIKWVETRIVPFLDENGTLLRVDGVTRDVTRNKKAEEELNASAANLRTIVNNTNIIYIHIDADFNIVSFNEPARKLVREFFKQELKSGTYSLDYYPEERKPFLRNVMDRLRRNEVVEYEVNYHEVNYIKDKYATRWYTVKYTPVRDDEQKTLGYILSMTNITDSKNAAIERDKLTSDLIQRNKDLEQFKYIVSHNIRAPLAAIIGLSNLLIANDVPEKDKENVLKDLALSAENLDQVILDMNNILHIREQVNEPKELISFNKLVKEIKTSINHTVIKENVVFRCDFEKAPEIFTLRSYLYTIFYHLSMNSIKYRQPELSPLITIRSIQSGGQIKLFFSDNGKGIDMLKHGSNLFGLYKRFDISVEGKGMGLFIVKTQVEALGGTIEVKSEAGKGLQVVIALPV